MKHYLCAFNILIDFIKIKPFLVLLRKDYKSPCWIRVLLKVLLDSIVHSSKGSSYGLMHRDVTNQILNQLQRG